MDNRKYGLTLEQKIGLCWQIYCYTRAVQDFERYKKLLDCQRRYDFDSLTHKLVIDVYNKLSQIERLKKGLTMAWHCHVYDLC